MNTHPNNPTWPHDPRQFFYDSRHIEKVLERSYRRYQVKTLSSKRQGGDISAYKSSV
jgi:hypothetical protein